MTKKAQVLLEIEFENENKRLSFLKVIHNCIPLYSDVAIDLPYRDNKVNVSGIPIGLFEMEYTYSPRFKRMLWLVHVPGRSGIRFHIANYVYQLNGCVAPGTGVADIDGDGILDVTNSKAALDRFHAAMKPFEKTGAVLEVRPRLYPLSK